MQHDDSGPSPQRVDDPAVRLRVVADVIERRVRLAQERPARACDLDLEAAPERGQEERAVVRDPRTLGRQRRVVRDFHPRMRAIARSQVTSAASACPARPSTRASSTCSRSHAHASATARASRLADDPGPAVGHHLERTAGIAGRHHRLVREERLVRHHPEVLVDRCVEDGQAAGVEVARARPRPRGRGSGCVRRGAARRRAPRAGRGPDRPPRRQPRSSWSRDAASIRRSTRFARSSRPTERTKSP